MTRPCINILQSQSDTSIRIERLIDAIQRTGSQAYRIPSSNCGDEQVSDAGLSKYFEGVEKMVMLFELDVDYQYSWQLSIFHHACQIVGIELGPCGITCMSANKMRYLSVSETLNELTQCIRALLVKNRLKQREHHDRRYQCIQQENEIASYVDAVLDRYARTCVVRVDLYYRKAAQARLRVERVFDDLRRLISERERNQIFDHETGYICSVEQGDHRGYHIHAAFFFNGSEVSFDIYRARLIGELWERITRGQGYYHNCNREKEKYPDRQGVGLIERRDANARENVHYAMRYLVKNDQHLRLRPVGARCLRKGLVKRI